MPAWTVEQKKRLIDMVQQKVPIEEIAEALHRSVDAITMKLKRMGLAIPEKCLGKSAENKVTKKQATTTTLPALKPAEELISMAEMMKVMLGALEQLKDPVTLSPLEIKRCRTIVTLARTYMHMLERYEKWSSLEQGLVDMEARFLEIFKQKLQIEKDPSEKAKLEKEIRQLEESLRESSKFYKPFEKKPSLTSPSKC